MVEHDELREGARQIGQLAELGVVRPGVEAEADRRQPRAAFAHRGSRINPAGRVMGGPPVRLVRMGPGDKADAAQAAAAGSISASSTGATAAPELEVGIADDGGATRGSP